MPFRLLAVTFDAQDPGRLAAFWAGVLGRVVVDDHRDVGQLPAEGHVVLADPEGNEFWQRHLIHPLLDLQIRPAYLIAGGLIVAGVGYLIFTLADSTSDPMTIFVAMCRHARHRARWS